uniref:Uncharacterized protein n=1 Tax=Timema shepardi TaxID=629360 RepID=A0A7R9G8Y4_TIMSH|nr:unnamed protein product [Timema shepardi]
MTWLQSVIGVDSDKYDFYEKMPDYSTNGLRILSLIGQNFCDLTKSAMRNDTSSFIPALLHMIALINEYKEFIDFDKLSCFCCQNEVDTVRRKKKTTDASKRTLGKKNTTSEEAIEEPTKKKLRD